MSCNEIGLFIIWYNARRERDKIINDIRKELHIIRCIKIHWTKEKFSLNLRRFYGKNLPLNSQKEKHCGNDEFDLIIIRDENPVYEKRCTSHGMELVNINFFDRKQKYRKWSGGGHKIHATNSYKECMHDLFLLTGIYPDEIEKVNDIPDVLKQDLIGSNGWENLIEFFKTLNKLTNYVVLRNFENIIHGYSSFNHGDIDLLVENKDEVVYISNAEKAYTFPYRVHYKINIGNEYIYFDFRYLGDQYYDINWEKEILKTKILYRNEIYIPNLINYSFSLLYHMYIHKPAISKEYFFKSKDSLSEIGIVVKNKDEIKSILDEYMRMNGYDYVEPIDLTVFYAYKKIDKNISLKRKLFLYILNFKEEFHKKTYSLYFIKYFIENKLEVLYWNFFEKKE